MTPVALHPSHGPHMNEPIQRALLVKASFDLLQQETPTAPRTRNTGELISLLRLTQTDGIPGSQLQEQEINAALAARLLHAEHISLDEIVPAGEASRALREIAFGVDGGIAFDPGSDTVPAHMLNPFDPAPLPLPLSAIYALASVLASSEDILLGEGISQFKCGYASAPASSKIVPPATPCEALGFRFSLEGTSSFSRTPHPTDSLPLSASGEYDLRILDRTDASPYPLLAHKVSFTATSYPVLRWDDAIALGNPVP